MMVVVRTHRVLTGNGLGLYGLYTLCGAERDYVFCIGRACTCPLNLVIQLVWQIVQQNSGAQPSDPYMLVVQMVREDP